MGKSRARNPTQNPTQKPTPNRQMVLIIKIKKNKPTQLSITPTPHPPPPSQGRSSTLFFGTQLKPLSISRSAVLPYNSKALHLFIIFFFCSR